LPRGLTLTSLLVAAVLACFAGCNGKQGSARRSEKNLAPYSYKPQPLWRPVQLASLQVALPTIANAEYVNDDSLCATCHEGYAHSFQQNVHRGQSCEQCHGPASLHLSTRGREPGTILSFKKLTPPERSELCLKCHTQDACSPGSTWRTSPHAHGGVSCTDCHTSHYNVPPGTPITQLASAGDTGRVQLAALLQNQPPVDMATIKAQSRSLGAITPHVCYRCHANMQDQEHLAHAHQICGAAAMDCKTCHDPHGQIRNETRSELCLTCHNPKSPTMAWHSSTHAQFGVACADCHNPHPNLHVQKFVNIQHTNIVRERRLPMSVNEPFTCYKCHGDIYAKNAMPSHHPIKEGKLVCSDCHDAHGQAQGNLKEPTVNMVCYRCHAEKQGPFAYEHPPVTENCSICHEPHGTVANNLLHQQPTFLCLRCHTGHRTSPLGPNHAPLLGDVGTDPLLQRAFYSDCTQCHAQIHGSDLPSPHQPHSWFR
jgi:DmsE family decaheme c-type cytochrome